MGRRAEACKVRRKPIAMNNGRSSGKKPWRPPGVRMTINPVANATSPLAGAVTTDN